MRTVTITKNVYKFGENKRVDKRIKLYFREHPSFFDYILEDRIETLKKLNDYISGNLDYSISHLGERGDYITITDYDKDSLKVLINLGTSCPLTGCCYDDDIIYYLKQFTMKSALQKYLEDSYADFESCFEYEYLQEMCDSNNYEFLEDGKIFN